MAVTCSRYPLAFWWPMLLVTRYADYRPHPAGTAVDIALHPFFWTVEYHPAGLNQAGPIR